MLKLWFILCVLYGIFLWRHDLKRNKSVTRMKESNNLYIFWDFWK